MGEYWVSDPEQVVIDPMGLVLFQLLRGGASFGDRSRVCDRGPKGFPVQKVFKKHFELSVKGDTKF